MSENISIDGDEVTIAKLVIESSALAKFLSDYEEHDFDDAFKDLIRIALDVRTAFTTDLETRNITESAKNVIERIDEAYTEMVKELEKQLLDLVNPKDGAVIKAFEQVTGDNLKLLLSPEQTPDPSPIARLRALITADLKGHQESVTESLDAVKTKLRIMKTTKKTALDGTDFEAKVDKIIQEFARTYGDAAESTGTVAESGGSKKGDTKVTLNKDDTLGKLCTLVWEAKTEKTFKSDRTGKVIDDQVKKELNFVINDRGSDAAILVLDSELLNLEDQPTWREYDGNKLLIIVDTFNPEPDLIRLAYLWGRWKSRSSIGSLEPKIDVEGIRGSFDEMNLRMKDLRNVVKAHSDAIESIESAGLLLKSFRKDFKGMMEELALMVNIKIDLDEVENEQ
jgi:hypothetical protein